MTETHDRKWNEFESLGEETVRKQLAEHFYSESKERYAHQWLAHRQSLDESDSKRQALALAKEANDLARSANEAASEANSIAHNSAAFAKRSAEAARTSNTIATLALIAAVIAITVSIIGLFLKR
jgi:ferric-dicitrate binding protein FerR (iron transport regulator)